MSGFGLGKKRGAFGAANEDLLVSFGKRALPVLLLLFFLLSLLTLGGRMAQGEAGKRLGTRVLFLGMHPYMRREKEQQ